MKTKGDTGQAANAKGRKGGTMEKRMILIQVVLALVTASVMLGVVACASGKGAEREVEAVMFPAEMVTDVQNPPALQYAGTDGHVQMRDMVVEQTLKTDSKFLAGGQLLVSVNVDLDPATGIGLDWGSIPPWVITVDNGPGFQGTWEGRFVGSFKDGKLFDFEAVGYGSGDFAGMIAVLVGTREVPGALATIDAYIINPEED